MSAEYYIADEFPGGVLLHSMVRYTELDEALQGIDARRFAHKSLGPKNQPLGFVLLRTQARIPFDEPADSSKILE